jgi:hypothetical protein
MLSGAALMVGSSEILSRSGIFREESSQGVGFSKKNPIPKKNLV